MSKTAIEYRVDKIEENLLKIPSIIKNMVEEIINKQAKQHVALNNKFDEAIKSIYERMDKQDGKYASKSYERKFDDSIERTTKLETTGRNIIWLLSAQAIIQILFNSSEWIESLLLKF